MAKVISTEEFKTVHCEFCGTAYEFQSDDKIDIICDENSWRETDGTFTGKTTMMLQCPVCGMGNKLEKRGG